MGKHFIKFVRLVKLALIFICIYDILDILHKLAVSTQMLDCGSPRNTPTRRSLPVMYALRSSGVSIIYYLIKGYGPLCFVVSSVSCCGTLLSANNQTDQGTAKLRWAGRGRGFADLFPKSVLSGLRVSYFFLWVYFSRGWIALVSS